MEGKYTQLVHFNNRHLLEELYVRLMGPDKKEASLDSYIFSTRETKSKQEGIKVFLDMTILFREPNNKTGNL